MPLIADRLRTLIVENIEDIKDADAVTSDARLMDMGMDSVSGLDLMLGMEEEFNVKFPEEMMTNKVFESHATLEAALKSLGAA